ncbi:MAG: transposase [Candidatus Zixiibacteriota bacterium]
MSRYARSWIRGGTFFFTVVTGSREKLFLQESCRKLLRDAYAGVARDRPFETLAICLLPEHLHCIWSLPEGDLDYPIRWKLIKEWFSKACLREGIGEPTRSDSKVRRGERGIWQRRYWEHTVRDEKDFARLCDYIHFNPVKHGLVKCPHEYPYSSFHRFVSEGMFSSSWGCCCEQEPQISSWMIEGSLVGE